ncbi:efflux RND transporter periplasmic adaptor subunit [Halioglobus maricola]|uniref:Efflux RND transporter periplasmic adaptor subunit n=1 Tax=Halioglobus maricola TaxID=2601894 RepID=A0A5P9NR11_9GAMM|nr:efflux RND transporter periplasmic adaptor subunit [Halioglobus maricola]QFU77378.1 efflux RND transporter periplasmic adaptor subunit [Halioglobus maricola]
MTRPHLLALYLGGIALLTGCQEPTVVEEAIEVVVVDVARESVTLFGNYVGQTHASKQVEVNPRVDGFLEEISFVEGSVVESRQMLYRIDEAPYQASLDRHQATATSRAAALAKSRRDLARIQPLFEEDAASQLDLDDAIAAVQQGEAAVKEAEADLRTAELQLEYTQLRAPIDGVIGESDVDVGALIQAGNPDPLTTIQQVDPIHVYFSMSALDYLNARRRVHSRYQEQKIEREGKALEGTVTITLPDDSIYRYKGTVAFTDPQVNPQTGTFAVRAVVPNPDRELLPGQYTRVRWPLEERIDALLIPEEAILIEQGGVYVYVVLPNNRVERRLIFVGPTVEGRIIVDKGLAADEKIIIHGINKVLHGSLASPMDLADYERQLEDQEAAKLQDAEGESQDQ